MTAMDSFLGPRVSHRELAAHRLDFLLPTLLLALAAVLLVTSIFLPYWLMELQAPQYPGGLEVRAHLDHLEGDVREIDGLNHYIGMRPLAEAAQLERSLSIAAVTVVALLVASAIFIHSPWAAVLALPALLFPLFFLGDLQYWLWNFGTDLDPRAPLSSAIEPFVPPVLGRGTVGQFATVTTPGAGLWLAFAASCLILVGLYFHRRAYKPLLEKAREAETARGGERHGTRSATTAAAFLAAALLALSPSGSATAAEHRVRPADGPDALAAAVAGAAAGDTIRVGGVWPGPLRIDRPLHLVAAPGPRPVIDGGGAGTVISVRAPGVTVEGFLIRASGTSLDQENSGIAVEAANARIVGNHLEDVLFGIYLRHGNESLVAENVIHGKDLDLPRRGDAIRVWYSDGVRLEGNRVTAARDVVLWYSEDLVVRGNSVRDGRYGLHFMYCDGARIENNELVDNSVGAFLMYSRRLRLVGNLVAGHHGPSGYGVGLKDMDDAEVRSNRFVDNRVGIFLDNTPREIHSTFLAQHNLLAANDFGVTLMPSVRRARFLDNSFVQNLEQVSVDGGGGDPEANLWRGNHWSDYVGFDADEDGTGDVPHRLDRLFESLGDRQPALRFFVHSPATSALDLAARAFPIVQPRPKLTDHAPSMEVLLPPEGPDLAGLGAAATGSGPLLATGAALVTASLLLWLAPMTRRRLAIPAEGPGQGEGKGMDEGELRPSHQDAEREAEQDAAEEPADGSAEPPLVETRGLTKRYGRHLALDVVNLAIRRGESVALWGANGAGKTTALRALLGVIPYEGEVRIAGDDAWSEGKRARRRLGFVPQEVTFQADLGVWETLELYARLRGVAGDDLESLLASLGLDAHAGKRVGELSGGLRQRLALAVALVDDPPVLLLDEPTANLDHRGRADLLALLEELKAAGKTLIFSSHRPEEVLELADRMVHLGDGRVVADGPPEELLGTVPDARSSPGVATAPRPGPGLGRWTPSGGGRDATLQASVRTFDLRIVWTLLAKELRGAWRNRWFLLYTAAFAALALGMSWLSVAGAAGTGFAGVGRTAASLVHLVMLVVPLMGLTLGADAIAGERERGSLILLLAQPLSRLEVVAGKFLGLAAAVLSSLFLGFGLALLVIQGQVRSTAGGGSMLAFLGLAALVAVVSVSLGLLISALTERSAAAGGVSLFVWLVLVLLGDLGLMGTSLVLRLDARHLLWSALLNPLQEFKVAALLAIRGGLEVLGPAGLYATRTYGELLMPLLVAGLVAWILVPLAITAWTLERRGAQ